MPIHDRSCVDSGIFHHCYQRWLFSICNALNNDLLPEVRYSLPERRTGERVPDVLTLNAPGGALGGRSRNADGPVAVRERPTVIEGG